VVLSEEGLANFDSIFDCLLLVLEVLPHFSELDGEV